MKWDLTFDMISSLLVAAILLKLKKSQGLEGRKLINGAGKQAEPFAASSSCTEAAS